MLSTLRHLCACYVKWYDTRDIVRCLAAMQATCPVGARVQVTEGCICGSRDRDKIGTVIGLSSFAPDYDDYQVMLDGEQFYALLCPRTLKVLSLSADT